MHEQTAFLLAIHRRLRFSTKRFKCLHEFFAGDWEKAYQACLKDWQAAGVDKLGIEKFFSKPEVYSPLGEMELLQQCGAQVLTLLDPLYPVLWQHMAGAPALVLVRGDGENLRQRSVAVVGSRKMTPYGERVLEHFLRPVCERGVTVVSGLAYGVDAAAHRMALACQAPTIAVLGNGIDKVYPRRNEAIGADILAAGGTLISEYLPRTQARPEYFPERNRLVAGLAQATVVVEGALKSGSLITARLANDMGREVWAIPGDVFRAASSGCNQLIARGEAAALTEASQLSEAFKISPQAQRVRPALSNDEQQLLNHVAAQNEWELEVLSQVAALDGAMLSVLLMGLELKGYVRKTGDKVYLY